MLLELHIKNFAIIDELQLEFAPGLNILTGETGAGKSIVIDAVELLMGGRASVNMLRAGAQQAQITGLFDLPRNPQIAPALTELGVPIDEDQPELILSRQLSAKGRSRARINGQPVTAAQLRAVAGFLLDLHGQHAYQTLLSPGAQRDLLDQFSGSSVAALREKIAVLHRHGAQLQRQLQALTGDGRERIRAMDLYRFQVEEIDAANFQIGEEEELRRQRLRLANATRLRQALAAAYDVLAGEDAGGTGHAEGSVAQAIGLLQPLLEVESDLKPQLAALLAIQEELASTARELRLQAETTQTDPAALDAVEERLLELGNLKQKYGDTIAEIHAFRQQAAAELARLEAAGEEEEKLQEQLAAQRQEMGQLCTRLSQKRRRGAAALKARLEPVLAELGMDGARFKVQLSRQPAADGIPVDGEPVAIDASGADKVQFTISTNPGEPLRPLTEVASGGELSRIMLALKSLLTASQRVPTVIFDEIDAGVGGRTALSVADKLKAIAGQQQVICVTHLPVIAAGAQRHFTVFKTEIEGRTVTEVKALSEKERQFELARMLGGDTEEAALAHARQLLAQTR